MRVTLGEFWYQEDCMEYLRLIPTVLAQQCQYNAAPS